MTYQKHVDPIRRKIEGSWTSFKPAYCAKPWVLWKESIQLIAAVLEMSSLIYALILLAMRHAHIDWKPVLVAVYQLWCLASTTPPVMCG